MSSGCGLNTGARVLRCKIKNSGNGEEAFNGSHASFKIKTSGTGTGGQKTNFNMKKLLVFLLLMAVMSLNGFAQKGEKAIGVNLGYGSQIKSLAIGVKFSYGVTDPIRVSPSFNYFIKKDGLSEWEINADVHYLFNVTSQITVYPLAGVTFSGWKFDMGGMFGDMGDYGGEVEDASSTVTRFGANVGAGIGYNLTDHLSVGLEAKYSIIADFDQFVPTINVAYKF
jgi:outer membrane protein X